MLATPIFSMFSFWYFDIFLEKNRTASLFLKCFFSRKYFFSKTEEFFLKKEVANFFRPY